MSSMNDYILKKIYGFNNFRDDYIRLEKSIASKSRDKVIQVKEELQNLKK